MKEKGKVNGRKLRTLNTYNTDTPIIQGIILYTMQNLWIGFAMPGGPIHQTLSELCQMNSRVNFCQSNLILTISNVTLCISHISEKKIRFLCLGYFCLSYKPIFSSLLRLNLARECVTLQNSQTILCCKTGTAVTLSLVVTQECVNGPSMLYRMTNTKRTEQRHVTY